MNLFQVNDDPTLSDAKEIYSFECKYHFGIFPSQSEEGDHWSEIDLWRYQRIKFFFLFLYKSIFALHVSFDVFLIRN